MRMLDYSTYTVGFRLLFRAGAGAGGGDPRAEGCGIVCVASSVNGILEGREKEPRIYFARLCVFVCVVCVLSFCALSSVWGTQSRVMSAAHRAVVLLAF